MKVQTGPLVDRPDYHAERSRCSSFRGCWVPVAKEPVRLVRQDGKRSDGLTLFLLKAEGP